MEGQVALVSNDISLRKGIDKAWELVLCKVNVVLPSCLDPKMVPVVIEHGIPAQSELEVADGARGSVGIVHVDEVILGAVGELVSPIDFMESIQQGKAGVAENAPAAPQAPLRIEADCNAKAPEFIVHVDFIIFS